MSSTNFVQRQTVIQSDWLNDVDVNVYGVKHYGADPTGVADSTIAITAAIAAASANGGGKVYFPAGTYKVTSGLVVNTNGVRLVGDGAGFFTNQGAKPVSIIKWAGSSGDVVTLTSVSGANNHKLTGSGIIGLGIDGNGTATRGLMVRSVNNSTFNVAVTGCTSVQVEFNIVAALASNDARDNQMNDIQYMRVWASGTQNGINLNTDGIGANTSMNEFGTIHCTHENGYGLRISNGDNNTFEQVLCLQLPGGTGKGVIFGAGDMVTVGYARANTMLQCSPGTGGVYAEGTPTNSVASAKNFISWLDKENGAADPTLEAGATLAWGTNWGVMTRLGSYFMGAGGSHTEAMNAAADAISTNFPLSIVSSGGKHLRLHNGTTAFWGVNVHQTTGNLRFLQSSGLGRYELTPAALQNYVNDAAAAAGGVQIGELYRNGSAVMIRIA